MTETITLRNVREGSDVRLRAKLYDNGVAVDWTGLENIKALIFSDEQRAVAGPCAVSIDPEDNTRLVCEYGAEQPQYDGINSLVVRCEYHGRKKTYDRKSFVFVERDEELEGEEVVLVDPVLDVELSVEEVSTSLLDNAIDAAFAAAESAIAVEERVSAAEALRVEAENARVVAENGRVAAESARHQQFTADHSTASSDHTTAGSDHTRAESDHETAFADHTRAGNDHTASTEATAKANNVNATVSGTVVTITDRNGISRSVDIGFDIYKTYASVAAMNADAANVAEGKFVMIATTDTTSTENARLYVRNENAASSETPFTFLCDLDQAASTAWADWFENYKPTIEADHTRAENDHTLASSDHGTAAADHTLAGTDHSTASADHTQAGTDHATAGNDHTRAENDHTQAGTDHTTAASDHTTAGTDHTTAEADHTTAGNDHTRAESDHTRAEADHTAAANKADKDLDAVEGNLAEFDSNGNPVDSGEKKEDYVKKGSWDSTLVSGLAENLIDTKGQGTEQSFTRRTSCGNESISDDGNALFKKLMGNSLVFNQLYTLSDMHLSGDGASYDDTNKILTFESTSTNSKTKWVSKESFKDHKYYVGCFIKSSSVSQGAYFRVWFTGGEAKFYFDTTSWKKCSAIMVSSSNYSYIPYGFIGPESGVTYYATYPIVIDLTLMFGAGKEPSTVAEFEALFPLPYYAYNAGQIIDNKVEEYQTVGFNQWDEEWELGDIKATTGANDTSSTNIRSKNYIPVFAGVTYYVKSPIALYARFYDANKNYLGYNYGGINRINANVTITIPDGVSYLRICGEATTYNHDICINLSWSGYRNGEYEPYWKNTLPLGLNSFKVTDGTNEITVTGLKSAGSVYDEIDLVRKKYIKRVGTVDMGTLDWLLGSNGNMYTRVNVIPSKPSSSSDVRANVICPRYTTAPQNLISAGQIDKIVGISAVNTVMCTDLQYTTAADFKAGVSGVPLYYELATPIEYDLVDEIQAIAPCADFGTEYASPTEEVDANGVPKSAPFRAQIKYSDDFTRILARRNQDLQNQESMDAFVSMLGGVLNGTITKTWDATNKKYTYSFTANA